MLFLLAFQASGTGRAHGDDSREHGGRTVDGGSGPQAALCSPCLRLHKRGGPPGGGVLWVVWREYELAARAPVERKRCIGGSGGDDATRAVELNYGVFAAPARTGEDLAVGNFDCG